MYVTMSIKLFLKEAIKFHEVISLTTSQEYPYRMESIM